jgi:hypothetical protein
MVAATRVGCHVDAASPGRGGTAGRIDATNVPAAAFARPVAPTGIGGVACSTNPRFTLWAMVSPPLPRLKSRRCSIADETPDPG